MCLPTVNGQGGGASPIVGGGGYSGGASITNLATVNAGSGYVRITKV
jgi:NAD(P)H-hydrate repair Nnr-like enzyme with NAD(P)H-hydrate dehydratase domain